MTRFARAHGSKASNERLPEEATSWSAMKQQLADSTKINIKKEDNNIQSDYSFASYSGSTVKKTNNNPEKSVWEVFDTNIACGMVKKENSNESSIEKKKGKKSKNKHLKNATTENTTTESVLSEEESSFAEKVMCKESSTKQKKTNSKSKMLKNVNAESLTPPLKEEVQKPVRFGSFEGPVRHVNKRHSNGPVSELDQKKMRYNDYNDRMYYNQNQFLMVGGKIVEISNFQGFPVKKEDAIRLIKLRKDLYSKGLPRKEVERALQLERRRAEKALAREKKFVCFKCRKFGHNMGDCPENDDQSGICFKCGSTEHSVRECRVVQYESFKYAHCFICQEQGHIARQCPDNPRGLYPKGGACKVCGDVTHLKKDCPQLITAKERSTITAVTVQNNSVEVLDEELKTNERRQNFVKKTNIVKF